MSNHFLAAMAITAGVALSGCAAYGTAHIPAGMRVATADRVDDCRLVGDVHGVSGLYGLFAKAGLAKARQQAFMQAHTAGANTIVWGPFATPYGATSVSGHAYACPPARE